MMNDGGNMWFGGGFMWLFWIVLIVVIIWAIKLATQGNSSNDAESSSADSALDVLKKRYANGEIDEQEYSRRKKQLDI